MEILIEEIVRGIGSLTLKLVTLAQYTRGSSSDGLREGALGLSLIALGVYVAYAVWP